MAGGGGAGSRSHLLFSAPAWSLVGEAQTDPILALPPVTSSPQTFLTSRRGNSEGFLISVSLPPFPSVLWLAYHSHSPTQMPLVGEADSGGAQVQ